MPANQAVLDPEVRIAELAARSFAAPALARDAGHSARTQPHPVSMPAMRVTSKRCPPGSAPARAANSRFHASRDGVAAAQYSIPSKHARSAIRRDTGRCGRCICGCSERGNDVEILVVHARNNARATSSASATTRPSPSRPRACGAARRTRRRTPAPTDRDPVVPAVIGTISDGP